MTTLRERVEAVCAAASQPLTSYEIAAALQLTHKQVIDALNALLNYERVSRIGRKSSSRWTGFKPTPSPTAALAAAFRSFAT